MLNLNEIFAANALEEARREAEEARLKAEALRAKEAWRAECDKLRAGLMGQVVAKATTWLKTNLIMPQELLRVEEFTNGIHLHLKMEDGHCEEREWEIVFAFHFKGESPESLKIKWNLPDEDRKYMESYCEYDDY